MKFNVAERLLILQLIPKEGTYLTLKVLRQLQDVVALSEEDIKTFEVHLDEDKKQIVWNSKGAEDTEIEIGENGASIVADELKKIDKEGKLTQQTYSLYEKFCATE